MPPLRPRNPESGTTELDESFLEVITYQGREFQKYSVENAIYFGPIDDVGLISNGSSYVIVHRLTRCRMK